MTQRVPRASSQRVRVASWNNKTGERAIKVPQGGKGLKYSINTHINGVLSGKLLERLEGGTIFRPPSIGIHIARDSSFYRTVIWVLPTLITLEWRTDHENTGFLRSTRFIRITTLSHTVQTFFCKYTKETDMARGTASLGIIPLHNFHRWVYYIIGIIFPSFHLLLLVQSNRNRFYQ